MKVLYDHQAFTFQRFGGVSKCFCKLIENLPYRVDAKISIVESENMHLRESHLCPNVIEPKINWRKWKQLFPFRGSGIFFRLFTRLGLLKTSESVNERYAIKMLREGDFDLFHPTFFSPYFLKYIGKKPWVITVHDMMPELFPEYFNQNEEQIQFKKKYLNQAAAIVAVSEQTKKDIVRLLGISDDKITVVYHGGPEKEHVNGKSIIDVPYFLYVGTRDAYKNFPQTILDFSVFHKTHPKVKLVCTGSPFSLEERAMLERLGIMEVVEQIYANELEMKSLYAHAIAFVYPSLYEGFGMPILEAFAYGCPVLVNNKSCFPEIAGGAGIFFDSVPGKSNLLHALEYIYSLSDAERKYIIEKGYKRLSCFSWSKSAEKLAKVYDGVFADNNLMITNY